jgi:hypothetical protein
LIEPYWNEIEQRMMALTLKQLRPIRAYFNGCLGGASTKADVVDGMIRQMRHWWRTTEADSPERIRIETVTIELEKAERP